MKYQRGARLDVHVFEDLPREGPLLRALLDVVVRADGLPAAHEDALAVGDAPEERDGDALQHLGRPRELVERVAEEREALAELEPPDEHELEDHHRRHLGLPQLAVGGRGGRVRKPRPGLAGASN